MDVNYRVVMHKYYTLFVFLIFTIVVTAQQNATFKETSKNYITYPYSDPNPIPADAKIYPYFRFDGFSIENKVQEWKVIELENEYIKVQIMPEIGGKIWTAFDKINGKDFF